MKNEKYGWVMAHDREQQLIRELETARADLAEAVESDKQASHDALHDLVMLRAEEFALNGGGPGIAERWKKAWASAEEIFQP